MLALLVRGLQWLAFVALCNGAGFLSALVANDPAYYQALTRPAWAPPPSVFAPAWITLYTLMGTATWLVWTRTRGPARRRAMIVFAVQLALNFAWTPVFFGLHQPGPGVIVILGVFAAVCVMLATYGRLVRLAGALLVPLLLWVAFATCLNVALWWLNR